MSSSRIPCPNCGTSILEVTAKYNDGLCALCKSARDSALHQRRLQEKRRNAPPDPINYLSFTAAEFIAGLAKHCLPHAENPGAACVEFLGFCDPILQRSSQSPIVGLLFHRRQLHSNLQRIPRPFRELMAVYQARGMIMMNGFEQYVETTISNFDREVDRGLEMLGLGRIKGVLSHARDIHKQTGGNLPKEEDDRVFAAYFDSMPEFEETILGPRLISEIIKCTGGT